MSEKTEEATPRRLRRAREEGDSGHSAFASSSVSFLVAASLVPGAIALLVIRSQSALRAAVGHAADESPTVVVDAGAIAADVVLLAVPVLLGAAIAAGVTSAVQTGGAVAMKALTPRLERLNVFAGMSRLFTIARLFRVVRSLALTAIVAYLAYRGLRAHLIDMAHASGRLGYVARVAATIAHDLALSAAIAGIAVGAVDLVVARRAWRARLRMTKAEVTREQRESDGDPEVKAARQRARQELVSAATIDSVRTASVIVADGARRAIALRYYARADIDDEGGDAAPVVVAAGEGSFALQILAAARAYGVTVHEDEDASRLLGDVALGDAIPETLYETVAEILRGTAA